jgi:hypothetical protein
MTFGSGIKMILRILPQQFERLMYEYNTDERDFLRTPWKWPQMARYIST